MDKLHSKTIGHDNEALLMNPDNFEAIGEGGQGSSSGNEMRHTHGRTGAGARRCAHGRTNAHTHTEPISPRREIKRVFRYFFIKIPGRETFH